jgi:hypothetical protein
MDRVLHIYGQAFEHEPVLIIGTTESLVELRDALDRAIESDTAQTKHLFANDGEGFDVIIRAHPEALCDSRKLAVPYTDGISQERRKCVSWPYVDGDPMRITPDAEGGE